MRIACLVAMIASLAASSAIAAPANDPSPSEIDSIIKRFAEKESEFSRARSLYTYRQNVRVIDLGVQGREVGRWEMLSDIVFDPDGKRTERVLRAPVPTLKSFSLSPEDEQDLRSVQPFVLTSKDIDKYHVRYLGRETLDEIGCLVFSVKPKRMEQGQRYFSGMIWVDDKDLQIVKSYGRATGVLKKNNDQQFPKFETYREQIDGKYWFPTYTTANDLLYFPGGPPVGIRMTVKYEEYKQFKSDVNIKFGDVVDPPPPTPAPAKPKP
jgi:hypothetical protein